MPDITRAHKLPGGVRVATRKYRTVCTCQCKCQCNGAQPNETAGVRIPNRLWSPARPLRTGVL
eukprot:2512186-Prymnesium_polylepis.1